MSLPPNPSTMPLPQPTTMPIPKQRAPPKPSLPYYYKFLGVLVLLLIIHAIYRSNCPLTSLRTPAHTSLQQPNTISLPEVIIFRRSKKTGSSSMLNELIHQTAPHNYTPLYYGPQMMVDAVRAESLKAHPPRLLIAQHNRITRAITRPRKTVIADTILDGYTQVTSYCRYFEKVSNCDDQMINCLASTNTRHLNRYRWAGRPWEDEDTYMDLPLSSAHPALSTTVFRYVLPDALLDVQRINSVGSACPEDHRLRSVYNKFYKELDQQVDRLRVRMLAMTGYPVVADRNLNFTVEMMLDKAEELEKPKYNFGEQRKSKSMSDSIKTLWKQKTEWKKDKNGDIFLLNKDK